MANMHLYDVLNIPKQHFYDFEFHPDFVNLPFETKIDIFTNLLPTLTKRIAISDARAWYKALTGNELNIPFSIPIKNKLTVKALIEELQKGGFDELAAALLAHYNGGSTDGI